METFVWANKTRAFRAPPKPALPQTVRTLLFLVVVARVTYALELARRTSGGAPLSDHTFLGIFKKLASKIHIVTATQILAFLTKILLMLYPYNHSKPKNIQTMPGVLSSSSAFLLATCQHVMKFLHYLWLFLTPLEEVGKKVCDAYPANPKAAAGYWVTTTF